VPPTLQGVIAARIDQLAKPERALLQTASAVGPRASLGLLRCIAGLPELELRRQLRTLDDSELLVEASLLPEHVFAFPHDLVRQVSYETMLETTRQQLHSVILMALESMMSEEDAGTDTLCRHALAAKDWRKACTYASDVARRCVQKSAVSDASRYYETAMDSLDRLPDSPDHEREAIDLRLESRTALSVFG
jgi:predicted ATPase